MRLLTQTFLCGLIAVLLLSPTSAETPDKVSYQGLLVDTLGNPLNGTHTLSFFLYSTPSGGTPLWTEEHTDIMITEGLFSVSLGRFMPLSESVFSQADRYLSISVDGAQQMMPRIAMVSVPYSFRVQTVDGAIGGQVDGNVQINGSTTVTGDITVGGEVSFASRTKYLGIPPAEWFPTQNLVNTVNNGNEVHALTNFTSMNIIAPISLPDGAVMEEVTADVRDDSPDYNIQGWVLRNTTGLGFSMISTASTSGTPGETALQVFSGARTVDNEQEAYYIRLTWLSPVSGDPAVLAAGMVTVRYSITTP